MFHDTRARDDRGGHLLCGILRGWSFAENIHVLLRGKERIGDGVEFLSFNLVYSRVLIVDVDGFSV